MNKQILSFAFATLSAGIVFDASRAEEPAATPAAAPAVKLMTSVQPGGQLDTSLANEVNAAVNRGLDWLAAAQQPEGYWSSSNFPALTALSLRAFVLSQHPKKQEIVAKAVTYILSCVREDGGIYREVAGQKGGGLSNYNTAICMAALHAVGDPALVPVVQRARRFVAAGQHLGGDVYNGGFGYDRSTGRAYTDLLNTYYATEAMRETQSVEDQRPAGEKKVDVDWKAAAGYAEKLQNKPGAGDEAGGFFYNPTDAKAGATTNQDGVVVFRSFGTMTYAGLLALVYAEVDRKDTRVRSAFEWASRHWTLEENPGMGTQGLYFFYNVLTKSLSAYGQDMVPLKSGRLLDWRGAVGSKLVQIQRIDPANGQGYWKNDNGRFWENDPVLATSYALVALELLR
jgi:squalene-hopene/tetraprenyl-beta-curcumene cyclase